MIRAAIIGTGNISVVHIQALQAFPDRVKIVALCNKNPAKAEMVKEKCSLKDAAIFDDYQKMLSSDIPIDLVHICTPPSTHAEIAISAMDAGKNVLVEKPMAQSLQQCDEMLAAEKRNHVTMAVIAQNRFRNSIYKLKKTLDSGLAGKLRVAHVDSLWWRGLCYYDLWWRGTWAKEGGGPTLNHAVHHIDMLNWMQGGLPTEVCSMLANVMHNNSECEDISFALCRYENGSVAEVTSSVVHHGEEQGLTLQCEKAKIAAPFSCVAETAQPNGFPVEGHNQELMKQITDYYNSVPDLKYEAYEGEIDNVLTALENGTRPLITGVDGRRTIELITAIYKAGFQKRTVTLPITEDDEYYTVDGIQKNAVHFYEKTTFAENTGIQDISIGNYKS